jgi:hypothetical protein
MSGQTASRRTSQTVSCDRELKRNANSKLSSYISGCGRFHRHSLETRFLRKYKRNMYFTSVPQISFGERKVKDNNVKSHFHVCTNERRIRGPSVRHWNGWPNELARRVGRLQMLTVVQNADRPQLKFGHPWTFSTSRMSVSVPWIHY